MIRPLLLCSLLFVVACSSAADDRLYGTLWVQTAAEYEGLARQTWRQIGTRVLVSAGDPTINAIQSDARPNDTRPAAIVVDVDETVLDNSPYQARIIEDGEDYASATWAAWVNEASAEAIPGAPESLRTLAENGVAVFYVTNRNADLEDATRRNLAARGFPIANDLDVVLMRNEHDEDGSDKTHRREMVAATHRIVALVGDDFGDFGPGKKSGLDGRREIVRANASRWGHTWFVLPNPMYGSWERSLYDFERLEGDERRGRQRAALRPLR